MHTGQRAADQLGFRATGGGAGERPPRLDWPATAQARNQLDAAERYHACDMRDDDYFSHDSKDWNGSSHITVCSFSQRIQNFYFNYQLAGENIAAGYPSPQAVMNGWLDSAGHRMNIERDTFYEIGVGYCAPGGYYGRYWVQNFGRRFN